MIVCRQTTNPDFDLINMLQAICLPVDEPYIGTDRTAWFLARVDGEIAGFAAVTDTGRHGIFYLARSGVLPDFRGHGLQRRLIMARIRYARRLGAREIVTDCTADNIASARSLIRCGFLPYQPEEPWALPTSVYWTRRP